jgi:hypothetical protein
MISASRGESQAQTKFWKDISLRLHHVTDEPNRLLASLTKGPGVNHEQRRITRLVGLALGALFICGLILNAFAF